MLRDLLQVLEAEAIFGSTPPHTHRAAAGAAAGAGAAAAAGWVVVDAEVRKRRRVLASGGSNVSLCVLELQDGIVKARGSDGTRAATAPLFAVGHPALHAADQPDRRRLEAPNPYP